MPSIRNSDMGVIVRHKEYIGDIGPSQGFKASPYDLNPGMDITFPWLSQIAMAFTEYEWRGLCFTFKTSSSDLVTSTNPSLGTVIMGTDYNAIEATFTDKRTMENYEGTVSSKPSLSFIHCIETERKQTPQAKLYTRDGPPPQNADIRLYDIGKFCLATQGMQATDAGATIGELWVSYEIEFSKPRFDIDEGLEYDTGEFGAVTTSFPLGHPNDWKFSGNLGGVFSIPGGLAKVRYTFPSDAGGKSFGINICMQLDATSSGNLTRYIITGSSTVIIRDGGIEVTNPINQAGRTLWNMQHVMVKNVQSNTDLPYIEIFLEDANGTRIPTGALGTQFVSIYEINGKLPFLRNI